MDSDSVKQCCAFSGHRPKSLPWGYDESDERCVSLKRIIYRYCVHLIENKNVNHFISGMAQGVDMYAAKIVLDLKRRYNISLECAIPCENQSRNYSKKAKAEYETILNSSDMLSYIRKEYTKDCMIKRNIYMVERAEYLIAVCDNKSSGTLNTINYAKEKNRNILLINPDTLKCYKYEN